MQNFPQDLTNLSDESVLRLSTDHPSVFEVLVDRYQTFFYHIAHKVLHSKEDAEDVVQEAFIKMYRAAHQLRNDPESSFKKWASAIVFRAALTKWRKNKKTWGTQEYFDILDYAAEGNEDPTGRLNTKIAVQQAVAKLPPDLREIIELHYLSDLPYEKIAYQKGLTIGSIKMRLFRARNLLKNYL